ncbi:MAG: HAMP domain-containing sensor histidine kinase [Candidatus Altiarchaeota archaeon]
MVEKRILKPSELESGEEKKLMRRFRLGLEHHELAGPEHPNALEIKIRDVPERFRDRVRFNKSYSHVAAVFVDREGRIRQMSAKMLDWRTEADMGKIYWEAVPNLKAEGRDKLVLGVMETGEPKVVNDIQHLSAGRGLTRQKLIIAPIMEGGVVVGAVIQVEDITKQKLFEEITEDLLAISDVSKRRPLRDVIDRVTDAAWRLSSVFKTAEEPKSKALMRAVEKDQVTDVFFSGPPIEQGGWTESQTQSARAAKGPTDRIWQIMVETGEPVIYNEEQLDAAVAGGVIQRRSAEERGFRSIAAIPLIHEGRLIGEIRVYNGRWGEEDRQFFKSLGRVATLALVNSREHAEVIGQRDLAMLKEERTKAATGQIQHDVGNVLLTTASGIGGILKRREELPAGIASELDQLGRGVAVASGILRSGLEELRSGASVLRTSEVDLDNVWDSISGILGENAGRRNLQLGFVHEPGLPHVSGDPVRIQQILLNLVGNALKFTDLGRIVVTARPRGNTMVVSVSDTGKGIPQDSVERVFKPMEQASAEDAAVDESGIRKGYGLGLAGVKSMVAAHGGVLRVITGVEGSDRLVYCNATENQVLTNEKDTSMHGSKFEFTLPCHMATSIPLEARDQTIVDIQDFIASTASDSVAFKMEDFLRVHLQADVPGVLLPTCIEAGHKGWSMVGNLLHAVLLPTANRDGFGLVGRETRGRALDGTPMIVQNPPSIRISGRDEGSHVSFIIENNNPENVVSAEQQAAIIGFIRPGIKSDLDALGVQFGFEKTEHGTAFVTRFPKKQ